MAKFDDNGDQDEDIYDEEGSDKLLDDDEISPTEEGFMAGEKNPVNFGVCSHCGKPLTNDKEKVVEREIKGERHWFCSPECAERGLK